MTKGLNASHYDVSKNNICYTKEVAVYNPAPFTFPNAWKGMRAEELH